jgi:hypothetical protein
VAVFVFIILTAILSRLVLAGLLKNTPPSKPSVFALIVEA